MTEAEPFQCCCNPLVQTAGRAGSIWWKELVNSLKVFASSHGEHCEGSSVVFFSLGLFLFSLEIANRRLIDSAAAQ